MRRFCYFGFDTTDDGRVTESDESGSRGGGDGACEGRQVREKGSDIMSIASLLLMKVPRTLAPNEQGQAANRSARFTHRH